MRDAFGVEAVTEALERESALLAHLNLHADYHRAELWKALIPATQLALLEPLLPEGVSPHAVGSFGDKLAFPVRLDAIPDAEQLIGWAYLANNYRILSYRPQADPSKCKERLARQIVDQWFGEEFDAKQQEWFRRFVSTARNVGLGIPTDLSSDVRTEIGSG